MSMTGHLHENSFHDSRETQHLNKERRRNPALKLQCNPSTNLAVKKLHNIVRQKSKKLALNRSILIWLDHLSKNGIAFRERDDTTRERRRKAKHFSVSSRSCGKTTK
jgi:hypothetical protein